ncbi:MULTISPECIES: HNH endonuclease [unclassified Methylocaldum]|jgi:putative restriction endonuclease|uniref:HNH endonuclease n=1 Tax=unclassified Methylocaldum TaxID=2622260 RepID=UPI00098B15FF|nr:MULTISPECIES: HNH endonuclease [unclassified Methylocaldum]MBP1149442.1 putative restriction endonuclease [Methylocaldum sp. RMAD-M]
MELEDYYRQFAQLKRAPNRIFPETTRHKAPHKPLLLLAIMEMIARGEITSRFISIADEITELNDLFSAYWRALMPITQTSSIAFPFSRLHSEPFWELVPLPGRQISREAINGVSSVSQLRQLALGANLDEDLFRYMTYAESRTKLTDALLRACLSDQGQTILMAELGVQHQAFRYSLELEAKAHKIKEPSTEVPYADAVRDQGFRRVIVNCYDHRCALCGVRIVTPDGHTAVEAAHIKPWSQFKDDDVQNGMALCRLCHWAFDEGLMSVDGDYRVLTSRQMTAAPNAAGFLITLAGRPIIGPKDQALWPDLGRLSWHRHYVAVGL